MLTRSQVPARQNSTVFPDLNGKERIPDNTLVIATPQSLYLFMKRAASFRKRKFVP
jgi:hypothetical protein